MIRIISFSNKQKMNFNQTPFKVGDEVVYEGRLGIIIELKSFEDMTNKTKGEIAVAEVAEVLLEDATEVEICWTAQLQLKDAVAVTTDAGDMSDQIRCYEELYGIKLDQVVMCEGKIGKIMHINEQGVTIEIVHGLDLASSRDNSSGELYKNKVNLPFDKIHLMQTFTSREQYVREVNRTVRSMYIQGILKPLLHPDPVLTEEQFEVIRGKIPVNLSDLRQFIQIKLNLLEEADKLQVEDVVQGLVTHKFIEIQPNESLNYLL